MTLRAKLTLWYSGVFALSGIALTTSLYLLIAHKMRSEADKFLEDEYEECLRITSQLVDQPRELEAAVRREIGSDRYVPLTYRLHDVGAGRDRLFVGMAGYRSELAHAVPIREPMSDETFDRVRVGDGDRPFRVVTGPLHPRAHPHLVVQLAMYTREVDKRIASLRKYLYLVLLAAVLLAALGGWRLGARSLKPIDELAAELGRIETSTLGERLHVSPTEDEIARLREALNRMLARLDNAFDQLQSFTANAAHELRTPLSALQCRLEVCLNEAQSLEECRDALDDALEQATELGKLVENLLLLARMDRDGGPPQAGDVDLAALLDDLAEPFALLASEKNVRLQTHCQGQVHSRGDPALLRRLFGNLLDNAVRYTPAGGQVDVQARAEDDHCEVAVQDTGVGIEPQALEHIFERFYRADPSRSRDAGGTGLGLSIAHRVAQLHGGSIEVHSTPGQGTTVRVRLPRTEPQDAEA
ncbi:MAG: sensor histidine kinase [Candidatus Brocadiia bacterium]